MFSRASSTLFLLLTLALVACTTPPSSPSSSPTAAATTQTTSASTTAAIPPAGRKLLTIVHPTLLFDLDPSSSYANESAVLANVYEPLLWYGLDHTLKPALAERWESSADGMSWTFFLRKGVTFHDGTPFNAEAVKFSVERTKKLNLGGAWIWDTVKEIVPQDEHTVVFKLQYPAALDIIAASSFAAWMISPSAADKDAAWFNAGHDAGTGPYQLESYEANTRLLLTRYEPYWGGWKPEQFDKVAFDLVEDVVVRQQKLESGEGDFTYYLPMENLASLDKLPDVRVVTNPSYQNMMLQLNTKKPPLDNPKVRQALSYSFPYDTFIQSVMGGNAVQSSGAVPKEMPGHDGTLMHYTYDLERAKALLKEAGYENGGFELRMTHLMGNVNLRQAGELWQAELAKLGIKLDVVALTPALREQSRGDPTKAQDAIGRNWWATFMNPYDFLFSLFHSEEKTSMNLSYYKNAEFDKLIDEANREMATDRDAAFKKFSQAQKILIDDAVAIFIADNVGIHVVREDIVGYVDNPAYGHVVFAYQLTRK